jgi:hypothetical protein
LTLFHSIGLFLAELSTSGLSIVVVVKIWE